MGFERPKAEALGYLDARAKTGCGEGAGNGNRRSLRDDKQKGKQKDKQRRDKKRPWSVSCLLDSVEGSLPASVAEEVKSFVKSRFGTLGEGSLVCAGFRHGDRPVDEERAAYDVLSRDEAPVTSVHAVGAVVAHGEVLAGRNDQVSVVNVGGQRQGPLRGDVASG
jgi:hypothetical protein